jgi:hypothetical protein
MSLQEIFSKLLGPGGRFEDNQKALGDYIGLGQSTVSAIKNGAPQWEDHFGVCLKILELVAATDLQPTAPEVIRHGFNGGKVATDDKKKPVQAKASSLGAFQAGRSKKA